MQKAVTPLAPPSIMRRLLALIYEFILLFAVVFIAAYLFSALTRFKGDPASPLYYAFQISIFGAIGTYFVWCWRKSGQTLPMKSWKIRLTALDRTRPSLARCWLRYTFAWIGPLVGLVAYKGIVLLAGYGMARFSVVALLASVPFFALNFAWALFDRERRFLHDRLAGTLLETA